MASPKTDKEEKKNKKKNKKEKKVSLKKNKTAEPAQKTVKSPTTSITRPATPSRCVKRRHDAEPFSESSEPAFKIRLTGAVPTVQLTLSRALEKPANKEKRLATLKALFNGQRTTNFEEAEAFLRLSKMA
ncbi:unnamed protein product [Bursaphelenchus okinawaensis]|uniref:Uncharacterized protein n=1 Tax=Bursaphelenchus okinawaensis TaxID=465554 RepID=A0A811JUY1_9BILA|nr:unnamed protein product [Bursaphelenchus okinawaensis]CAG9085008.1 unnamed protein product [Bursaphelenchus okinawaensis]